MNSNRGPHNCWEFKEQQGDASMCQTCIVKKTVDATGFLGGQQGGRACMFIANTNCADERNMSIPEKIKNVCTSCEFYQNLRQEYNGEMNYFKFRMHLKDKKL